MPVTTAVTDSTIEEYNAQIIDNSVNIKNFACKLANDVPPQASSVSLCLDKVLGMRYSSHTVVQLKTSILALERAAKEALRDAPRSGVTTLDILLQSDAYLQASHLRLRLLLVLNYDPLVLRELFCEYEELSTTMLQNIRRG